jgi:hypothetical protein
MNMNTQIASGLELYHELTTKGVRSAVLTVFLQLGARCGREREGLGFTLSMFDRGGPFKPSFGLSGAFVTGRLTLCRCVKLNGLRESVKERGRNPSCGTAPLKPKCGLNGPPAGIDDLRQGG